jgi:hypothetical protein
MFYDISPDIPVQTESLATLVDDPADFNPFKSTAAGYSAGLAGEQGVMWRVQLQLEF